MRLTDKGLYDKKKLFEKKTGINHFIQKIRGKTDYLKVWKTVAYSDTTFCLFQAFLSFFEAFIISLILLYFTKINSVSLQRHKNRLRMSHCIDSSGRNKHYFDTLKSNFSCQLCRDFYLTTTCIENISKSSLEVILTLVNNEWIVTRSA